MMLTGLAGVLRDAGLKVVEVGGWKTRGHGEMTNVHGLTVHHTASGRSLRLKLGLDTVIDGRPGLDGPLAHLYLDVDGTWYVVAAGLTYHAGVSLNSDYTNAHRIGVECHAAGDGWSQDWPDEQMDSLALGAKALADHYDFDVSDILGHKETCSPHGRKIDPSFDMAGFRNSVREADVLTSADKTWIARKIEDLLLEILTERKLVPNMKVHPTDPERGNFTITGALAYGDKKADISIEQGDDILGVVTPTDPEAK